MAAVQVQTSRALLPATAGRGGAASSTLPAAAVGAAAPAALEPKEQPQQQQARPAPTPRPNPFMEPGLQQQVAASQQAQAWVGDMDQQLQRLKTSLAASLASGSTDADGAAAAALQQARTVWGQRSERAAGRIDGQLRLPERGSGARQDFTLRGLDLAALGQEGPETLSFAAPGSPAAINVAIDPDQTAEANAQRLDQALAPAGLRVSVAAGRLQWSTEESRWPALRDGLTVKGEGKRFPSGQRVRVRLDAQPDAVDPKAWRLDGAQARRQTLAQVIDAQRQLRDAGQALQRNSTPVPEPTGTAGQGQVLLTAAEDFRALAAQPVYETFAELAPALRRIGREQVRALLSR